MRPQRIEPGAGQESVWDYPRPPAVVPFPGRVRIVHGGHLAFYAQLMDECWVDDEQVQPNPGNFYGGWITSAVVGPFKGGPGTRRW